MNDGWGEWCEDKWLNNDYKMIKSCHKTIEVNYSNGYKNNNLVT